MKDMKNEVPRVLGKYKDAITQRKIGEQPGYFGCGDKENCFFCKIATTLKGIPSKTSKETSTH
jgi:hypothetical protein